LWGKNRLRNIVGKNRLRNIVGKQAKKYCGKKG